MPCWRSSRACASVRNIRLAGLESACDEHCMCSGPLDVSAHVIPPQTSHGAGRASRLHSRTRRIIIGAPQKGHGPGTVGWVAWAGTCGKVACNRASSQYAKDRRGRKGLAYPGVRAVRYGCVQCGVARGRVAVSKKPHEPTRWRPTNGGQRRLPDGRILHRPRGFDEACALCGCAVQVVDYGHRGVVAFDVLSDIPHASTCRVLALVSRTAAASARQLARKRSSHE